MSLCQKLPILKIKNIEDLQFVETEGSEISVQRLPLFVSVDSTSSLSPPPRNEMAASFKEGHIFDRARAIENCFSFSRLFWPEDAQAMINRGTKPSDTMRNEIVRKIVRRMEENFLTQDSDYVEVAEQALRKFPILNLRSVAGTEALVNQMKKCSKNHEQYINRLKNKRSAGDAGKKSHEKLMDLMNQELIKQSPSVNVLESLLVQCRKKRQEDAKKTASAVKHLQDYPALRIHQLVLGEFEAITALPLKILRSRWIAAVPKIIKYFAPSDSTWTSKSCNQLTVQVLLLITRHFKARFGQENRTKHIIEIFKEGTTISDTYPKTEDPPRLIAIGSENSPNLKVFIYIDGKPVFSGAPLESLLYLLALYCVFNISYAAEAKVAFIFLGAVLLQKKFEKSYRKFNRVIHVLEELDLF